jgi:HEPN domain
MAFDRKLKRIEKKNWSFISSKWLSFLPLIDQAGSPPIDSLNDNPHLAQSIIGLGYDGEKKEDIKQIRPFLFHEGIFLLHKATNVLEASESNFIEGFPTWSLSSGYQSSFFAAKSILAFMGVAFPRISGSDCIIDVWPLPEDLTSKQKKMGIEPDILVKMIKEHPIQHFHVWKILQRIVNTSDINVDLWPNSYIEFIMKIDDFSFQRNVLHYSNYKWILSDIHDRLFLKDFAARENFEEELREVDENTNDFSILLTYVLISMSYSLLNDIARNAPIIQGDRDLLNRKLKRLTSFKFIF